MDNDDLDCDLEVTEESDNGASSKHKYSLLDSVSERFEQNRRERESRIEIMQNKREVEVAHSQYLKNQVVSKAALENAKVVVDAWANKHGKVENAVRRLVASKEKTFSPVRACRSQEVIEASRARHWSSPSTSMTSPLHSNHTVYSSEAFASFDSIDHDLKFICPVVNCSAQYKSRDKYSVHKQAFLHSSCNPCLSLINCELPEMPHFYICPKCGDNYQERIRCYEHMIMNDHLCLFSPLAIVAFACPQCFAFYDDQARCSQHMVKEFHKNIAFPFSGDFERAVSDDPFTIPISKGLAEDFINKCSNVHFQVTCSECNVSVLDYQQLKQHGKTHFISSQAVSTPAEVFSAYLTGNTCTSCGQILQSSDFIDGVHHCERGMTGNKTDLNCKTLKEFVRRVGLTLERNANNTVKQKSEVLIMADKLQNILNMVSNYSQASKSVMKVSPLSHIQPTCCFMNTGISLFKENYIPLECDYSGNRTWKSNPDNSAGYSFKKSKTILTDYCFSLDNGSTSGNGFTKCNCSSSGYINNINTRSDCHFGENIFTGFINGYKTNVQQNTSYFSQEKPPSFPTAEISTSDLNKILSFVASNNFISDKTGMFGNTNNISEKNCQGTNTVFSGNFTVGDKRPSVCNGISDRYFTNNVNNTEMCQNVANKLSSNKKKTETDRRSDRYFTLNGKSVFEDCKIPEPTTASTSTSSVKYWINRNKPSNISQSVAHVDNIKNSFKMAETSCANNGIGFSHNKVVFTHRSTNIIPKNKFSSSNQDDLYFKERSKRKHEQPIYTEYKKRKMCRDHYNNGNDYYRSPPLKMVNTPVYHVYERGRIQYDSCHRISPSNKKYLTFEEELEQYKILRSRMKSQEAKPNTNKSVNEYKRWEDFSRPASEKLPLQEISVQVNSKQNDLWSPPVKKRKMDTIEKASFSKTQKGFSCQSYHIPEAKTFFGGSQTSGVGCSMRYPTLFRPPPFFRKQPLFKTPLFIQNRCRKRNYIEAVKLPELNRKVVPVSCVKEPQNLDTMHHIIFLDLDNWSSFFKFLPFCLPDKTFVWAFFGAGLRYWKVPTNLAFQRLWEKGWLHFHEQCGSRKDAADFAICLTIGKMDERLPKKIPFTILSGDKGFIEIERQMESSPRRTVVINPHEAHKHSDYLLYDLINDVVLA